MDDVNTPAPATPSPPDINKDPIYCVLGGTILAVTQPFQLAKKPSAYFTIVPVENPPGQYPRDTPSYLLGDIFMGTVPEILEAFGHKLTVAFNALTLADSDPPGVIPFTGEASLDKQTAIIKRMRQLSPYATPEWLAERERIRSEMDGYTPTQTATDRLTLQGLVSQWANRQFRRVGDLPGTAAMEEQVADLINALQNFQLDQGERKRAREHKQAQEQQPNV